MLIMSIFGLMQNKVGSWSAYMFCKNETPLICCRAESPASMEDLPLWKFEDRVETFSTKDPALAFSGQKAAQVNASHFPLLWPPRIMPYSPAS
jgi:hypothetical protein